MIVSCYCPTYSSAKTGVITFYNKIFYFDRHISKRKVLTINGDMNVEIGKVENYKFCFHNSSNRNGEYLAYFFTQEQVEGRKTINLHQPK